MKDQLDTNKKAPKNIPGKRGAAVAAQKLVDEKPQSTAIEHPLSRKRPVKTKLK